MKRLKRNMKRKNKIIRKNKEEIVRSFHSASVPSLLLDIYGVNLS